MAAAEDRRFLPSPALILLRGHGEPLIAWCTLYAGKDQVVGWLRNWRGTTSMHLFTLLSLFLGAPLCKTPMFLSHVSSLPRFAAIFAVEWNISSMVTTKCAQMRHDSFVRYASCNVSLKTIKHVHSTTNEPRYYRDGKDLSTEMYFRYLPICVIHSLHARICLLWIFT